MFTVQLDVKTFGTELLAAIGKLENAPETHGALFAQVMRQGALENFQQLAFGGSISTLVGSGGGSLSWPTTRSRQTVIERRIINKKFGDNIGPIYPMLSTRSNIADSAFYQALMPGIYTATPGHASLAPSTLGQNIAEHHYGTSSALAFRRQGIYTYGTLPERPFMVWTPEMAEGIIQILKAAW